MCVREEKNEKKLLATGNGLWRWGCTNKIILNRIVKEIIEIIDCIQEKSQLDMAVNLGWQKLEGRRSHNNGYLQRRHGNEDGQDVSGTTTQQKGRTKTAQ